MTGFIKLHRQIRKWQWVNDAPTFNLFIHLLLNANYEDNYFRGQLVKRGQLITGRTELAKITGLSEQQIRTALKKLESTNEIKIDSSNKSSVITIINYHLYQEKRVKKIDNEQPANDSQSGQQNQSLPEIEEEEATSNQPAHQPASNQQATSKNDDEQPAHQPASNQHFEQERQGFMDGEILQSTSTSTSKQPADFLEKVEKATSTSTTSKEVKETKNKEINNNISAKFEVFWQMYNHKKSRKTAEKSFEKALKVDSFENVMNGLKKFVQHRGKDSQYWKHPATWLNQECWKDEYKTNNKHNNFNQKNYDKGTEGFIVE